MDKEAVVHYIYIYIYIYMESRKMILMNLFAGQQWRHIENRLMDVGLGRG